MSERRAKTVLLAIGTAWYVGIGVSISEHARMQVEADCPGHRTAWEAYPVVSPVFFTAAWPIAGIAEPLNWALEAAFGSSKVCDRFDERKSE